MAPRVPGSGKSGRCSAWMLWDDSWDEPGLSCSWPPRLDIRVGVAAQPKPDTPTRQAGACEKDGRDEGSGSAQVVAGQLAADMHS